MDTNPTDHITNRDSNSSSSSRNMDFGGKLLGSEKYSDLTIVCHGRSFKVHRPILCFQSKVIEKECDIEMSEKRTGVIEHQEFDDDTMERMIDFAYKGRYETTRRPKCMASEGNVDLLGETASLAVDNVVADAGIVRPESDEGVAPATEEATEGEQFKLSASDMWVIHARVYGLADYYEMSELRDHAQRCFKRVALNESKDVNLDGFINVVREVCQRTTSDDSTSINLSDKTLRSGFLSLVWTYATKLATDRTFIAALCDPELKDITVDIFRVLGQRVIELEEEKKEMASGFQKEKESLLNVRDAKISGSQQAQELAEGRLAQAQETIRRLQHQARGDNNFGELVFERGKGRGGFAVRRRAEN